MYLMCRYLTKSTLQNTRIFSKCILVLVPYFSRVNKGLLLYPKLIFSMVEKENVKYYNQCSGKSFYTL